MRITRSSQNLKAGLRWWAAILLVLPMTLSACVHPRGPLVVTDPDPSIKIPATEKAVRNRDLSAVSQLIKDLDSDDPAVRLYASHALHDLTGKDFGYRYFDGDAARDAAVARWKQWYAQQQQSPDAKDKTTATATTARAP